ncbi:hypothetical protein ACAG24_009340 [Mycobacterium sp. pW049]|uniref:hypothetical protein n=1 Tax=[Mycobacterium] bulgaricum TaxID=3238985 RepID=UPI00351BB7F1
MIDYTALPSLAGVYLEDSYVLEIIECRDRLVFNLDAVLTPEHPAYHSPLPGEHYCYTAASLVFPDVGHVEWVNRSACRFTDATGAMDLGNIDSLTVEGNLYAVEGDWGMVRIQSSPPRIDLKV